MNKQLTREEAIEFGESKKWEPMSFKERALFQMNQTCLCMPFSTFHEAVQKALGRPVWTHEFAFKEALLDELNGKVDSATFDDVLNKIPNTAKTILVATHAT